MSNAKTSSISSRGHAKGTRDLLDAPTLRPIEIYRLYGMPVTTLSGLCVHPDPEKRIVSYKVPGRRGRKGSRYIDHNAFKEWLKKWKTAEGRA